MERKLLFLDLETTGLKPVKNHTILEVAAAVVDQDLKIVDSIERVVNTWQYELTVMDEWCTKTHTESGLVKAALESQTGIGTIEEQLIEFVKKHFKEKAVLAGNSVHFDKEYIEHHMPNLAKLLSHRVMDVSSHTELYKVLYGHEFPRTQPVHRAMPDVLGSIQRTKDIRDILHDHFLGPSC